MKAQYVEKYSRLSDMNPGDVAVSKDREQFFICGLHCHEDKDGKKENIEVILDINRLGFQYSDNYYKDDTLIRILKLGDRFNFVR